MFMYAVTELIFDANGPNNIQCDRLIINAYRSREMAERNAHEREKLIRAYSDIFRFFDRPFAGVRLDELNDILAPTPLISVTGVDDLKRRWGDLPHSARLQLWDKAAIGARFFMGVEAINVPDCVTVTH